jgi:hypothetical protein
MSTQLHLSLTPDLEARLRAKAQACGEDPERHAERLLSDALSSPSLQEILAPFRQEVAQSGMSDEDLDSFYEGLRDKAWQDRHPKKSA